MQRDRTSAPHLPKAMHVTAVATHERNLNRRAVLQSGMAVLASSTLPFQSALAGNQEQMTVKTIPSSGKPLPAIGCGTWQTFDVDTSTAARQPLTGVLQALAENGGAVVDSSPMYGRSEAVAGDLIKAAGLRDKIFIATKVWTRGRAEGIAQMETSFRLFQTDHIDLMQVHNLVDVDTHLDTLRGWKADGRISYLGVTHYHSGAYDELEAVMRKHRLDFVQLNYAMDDRAAEQRLLPLAAERGIAILVNRPFGGGNLLRRLLPSPLPAFAPEIGCTSWAQILLKFVVSHPAVTCAIPGTGKEAHMRDNARAGFAPWPNADMRETMAAAIKT
ncbi:MAG: aldo/keto reductase [Hyphomicrobium sp.]